MADATPCRVCGAAARDFGTLRVLGRHDVRWYECPQCAFVQTEPPHWLAESYADAIAASDLGPVNRAEVYSKIAKAVILAFFDERGPFVDYGGGYGLFVRMMRDKGFDFRIVEKYCENLFARGFEADPASPQRFELLTAFEVMEHLTDPAAEIERMLALSDNLLFTTELLPPERPRPGAWWYYAPEHGQHVAIWSLRTLETIAKRCSLHLASDGVRLHLLSRAPVNARRFRFVTRQRVAAWLDLLRPRPSLLLRDFEEARTRALAAAGDGSPRG